MGERIIVVDDERDIAEILQFNLRAEGYDVDVAFSAEEALPMIQASANGHGQNRPYSLVLLDVMMGEISGFGLAGLLRKDPRTADVPIIFITALDGEREIVKGLDIGADDYIPKPLSMAEVKARVRAVLRRNNRGSALQSVQGESIKYEGICIDTVAKTLTVDGKPVILTHLELEILTFLIQNKGRVYSRAELIERLWPEGTVVLERTVDVNITRIRKKIEPYGGHIQTRVGYGYRFSD